MTLRKLAMLKLSFIASYHSKVGRLAVGHCFTRYKRNSIKGRGVMEYEEHADAGLTSIRHHQVLGVSEHAPQELPEGLEVQVAGTMNTLN